MREIISHEIFAVEQQLERRIRCFLLSLHWRRRCRRSLIFFDFSNLHFWATRRCRLSLLMGDSKSSSMTLLLQLHSIRYATHGIGNLLDMIQRSERISIDSCDHRWVYRAIFIWICEEKLSNCRLGMEWIYGKIGNSFSFNSFALFQFPIFMVDFCGSLLSLSSFSSPLEHVYCLCNCFPLGLNGMFMHFCRLVVVNET